ncbi:CsiV family protein [Teredinibacter sp. KSP-S5-2]|uniref:CsiV family protein n=1 Tax=Teredinibacter sp. KSP-S5-2 TaxID=3034506 RepID=UPI0029346AE7|nr:CsiV family protein [Teredinibacter sp. KSP-S5-2]WNO07575.1 CsiV family protein [Teredinibacter sp. KSP-S5-2]
MKLRKIITYSSLALLLSSYGPVALGQTAEDSNYEEALIDMELENQPPWYQVNIIIFERGKFLPTGNGEETWPKNIALAYPPNVQELKTDEEPTEAEPDAESQEQDTLQLRMPNTEEAEQQNKEKSYRQHLSEMAYHILEAKDNELQGEARAIDRKYRILFNKAWRQPMQEEALAPSIIIQGGEKYGRNNELAGTVQFSISRYLHLKTNIWFAEFETNYGQEKEHWPPLPLSPNEIEITQEKESLASFSTLMEENENPLSLSFNNLGLTTNVTSDNSYFKVTSNVEEAPFLTKNIVLMKQKRRMRSGELHYIDHPKLGILVLITPVENDRLKTLLLEAKTAELEQLNSNLTGE